MRRLLASLFLGLLSCTRFGPVYPSRPAAQASPLLADPTPSRLNVHVSISGAGLRSSLDQAVPLSGSGSFPLVGSERPYQWVRVPLGVSFGAGKIEVKTVAVAHVELPAFAVDVPFNVSIASEPVISSAYQLKLQAVEVKVSSDDKRLKLVEQFTDVFGKVGEQIAAKVRDYSYDLRPMLEQADQRVQQRIDLPLEGAHGCAELRVLGVEAAPMILADGLERDFALVVAPSVTIPCTPQSEPPPLPPLQNVAAVPTGPFTLTVPVVASYAELTRSLSSTFTDGKLFFSSEHPKLYLEKPELYESSGALVLKLHIAGPVHELGIDTDINGDLYLVGHPSLVDNEISLPDLQPTIETSNFLLSLKAMKDGDRIQAEARKALRLDLAARLLPIRQKLSSDLTFGDEQQCLVGTLDKLELTELHTHATYLRVHVVATARAAASLPCQTRLGAPPVVEAAGENKPAPAAP